MYCPTLVRSISTERRVSSVITGNYPDLLAPEPPPSPAEAQHGSPDPAAAHQSVGTTPPGRITVRAPPCELSPPSTIVCQRCCRRQQRRRNRTLQHLADPHAAIKELIRVVRPGGRIVLADPD
ncbi:methyltransferase domain-containing protein [Micromonospora sp. NPDC048999]|uniref:methyltransferase domain-containing protein n=1 Tax=Micromonospora sp. NPDC048999 TaxID=3155391 RepID=UPI0033F52BD8